MPTTFLAGPKIIVQGDSGTGKTFSLGTLADWAARQTPPRPFAIVFTESGLETFKGYWADRNLPIPPNVAWHVSTIPAIPYESLVESARNAANLSYETLTKTIDASRGRNNPWEKFIRIFNDVPDDRTGKTLGPIAQWTPNHILALDSLSEMSNAAMRMVTGSKVVAAPPEYQVAQNNLFNWLRFMTQNCPFTIAMTAHVQRIVNETTGVSQLMTSAIGKALGDDIPRLFSEVIFTVRNGAEWYWDTAAPSVATKVRYLPVASKLRPDFAQIMDIWEKRRSAA